MGAVIVNRAGVRAAVDKIAFAAVRRAGLEYVRFVKRAMRESPASGRVYPSRRPGGGLHRASAPGEPPAPDTRKLVNAVTVEVRREGPEWVAAAGVGPGVAYWRALEFGTMKMLPRPVWRPQFQPALASARAVLTKAGLSEAQATGAVGGVVAQPGVAE